MSPNFLCLFQAFSAFNAILFFLTCSYADQSTFKVVLAVWTHQNGFWLAIHRLRVVSCTCLRLTTQILMGVGHALDFLWMFLWLIRIMQIYFEKPVLTDVHCFAAAYYVMRACGLVWIPSAHMVFVGLSFTECPADLYMANPFVVAWV